MNLSERLKPKNRLLYDEPLARHTTFGIGGSVRLLAVVSDEEELREVFRSARAQGVPVFVLGGGSKLLIAGGSLTMIAVALGGKYALTRMEGGVLFGGAGCGLQTLIQTAMGHGYGGLESMAGIPGTVGGAVKMNAGAGLHGPWISNYVRRVKVYDSTGNIRWLNADALEFGYRRSMIRDMVVLEVEFTLCGAEDPVLLLSRYKKFLEEKKMKQELALPSAGSIFKNPAGQSLTAGQLIEQCGLKGRTLGGATISPKHANFIVAAAGASYEDVTGLIDIARGEVARRFNIALELEVEVLDTRDYQGACQERIPG
ncbi:MAG: UDP-N-acetylmuramate dehydrogenase [Candidatus Omnitrophota bacterium]